MLKLTADAPASNTVHLVWYDTLGGTKLYLIRRSADDGKTWRTIGNEKGGDGTGPKYEHLDVDDGKTHIVDPNTDYQYRLEIPTGAVISDIATVTTPEKNLLEVANGTSQLQLKDLTSAEFWKASFSAAVVWLLSFVPRLAVGAVIFVIFYIIYRITRTMAISSMKRANVDPSIHDLLITGIKWSILGFALVMACDQIGVHITALLTGISIMGLAIGFAAQETLANLIASVVIFWDRPFKVGDWITLDGRYGRVQRITFRSTRVLTQNGDIICAPNTSVLSTQLLNHSTNPLNWVNVPVTIPGTIRIVDARRELLATCTGDDRLLTDPPPRVVVDSLSGDSVNLALSFCIKDEALQLAIIQDYLEKAKNALDKIKETPK
jgi:small conductance mechanosensitive channel